MSKIYWVNIFKLNEVNQYCNSNDLSQLSMVCKVLRASSRYAHFNYFSLGKFMSCMEYKSCVIDLYRDYSYGITNQIPNYYKSINGDLLESKRQFKSDLDLYGLTIDRPNLHCIFSYFYLVYEIPNVFQNLRSLYLNKSVIMFDNFQTLMSKLNILEDLDLNNVYIYKRVNESKNTDFPLTLKKLKLRFVSIDYFDENEDEAIFGKYSSLVENYDTLDLPSKNLPSLLLLRYEPNLSDYNGNNLLKFLKLNQHIKYLYIPQLNSSPEIFNLVKTFKNLVKLEYSNLFVDYIINTGLISSSVGSNIKKLCVSLSKDSKCLKIIVQQFPNLTDLYIENEVLEFNQLWSILPKFKKLKNLKLQYYEDLIQSKELNSQIFTSLESIHLMSDKDISIETLNFNINSFPKLNLIRFTHRRYPFNNLESPKLPLEVKINWKLIYFPNKVSLYRINQ